MTVSKDTLTKLIDVVNTARHVSTLGDALVCIAYVELHRKHLSPSQWRKLKIASSNLAGLKDQVKSRVTGTTVSIYDSVAQGLETDDPSDDGESSRWTVVCETHSTLVVCSTMSMARYTMSHPESFCDECRELLASRQS